MTTTPIPSDSEHSVSSPEPTRKRRIVLVTTALVAFGVLGTGGAWAGGAFVGTPLGAGPFATAHASAADTAQSFQGATETIQRSTLEGETSVSATLRYADSHSVRAGSDGVITEMPSPGTVLTQGQRMYRIGDTSTWLMHGEIPAWRQFDIDMSDGQDVKQLETSLKALGYFQKEEPNNRFDYYTQQQVIAWQKDNGLTRDGIIPLGTLLFSKGDVRIGTHISRVGDNVSAGTDLYNASSTAQVVEGNVKLADQQLAVIGAKASLHLPDGTTSTGTISQVGTPIEKAAAGSADASTKERVIPITVTPDDPNVTGQYQEVSLTVGLASSQRENVLSVPVGALVALTPEQFGVEVVNADGTTKRVPVATGVFVAGRVEISGEDISEGQNVVVPQR